jgi:AcrR family transcriptional regulator
MHRSEGARMSPRTPGQYERLRDRQRRRICRVALKLFAQRGYHATPVSLIAARAGISKGLMYHYFATKKDLLLVLIREGLAQFNALFAARDPSRLSRAQLSSMLDALFSAMASDAHFWRLFYALFLQPHVLRDARKPLFELTTPTMSFFEGVFRACNSSAPAKDALLFSVHLDGLAIGMLAYPDMFGDPALRARLLSLYGLGKEHHA